jgi:tetratricopeptide (TPR) repeat protein
MEKSTVLLADENHAALEELAKIFKSLGFTNIIQSDNASNAWTMIQLKELECVVSAWEMKEMSGLALLRIVRSSDRFFNLPVFLMHSAYTKGMVVSAGQEGVTGLMVTPCSADNIKKKMEALKFAVLDPEQKEAEKSLQDALKLIESENYGTAVGILENLVKIEENAEYYYNLGYVKTAQGNYTEAIQAFRKATAIDRLYAKAYEGMGRAYQKIGKPEEAEKFMIRAADIHMSRENVEEAEMVLDEIKEINPNTVNIYNSFGVLYRKKGDFKKALFNYKKAIVIHPDRARIHYNIGRLYIEMKDPEMAKSYFVQALKLEPDFEDAREVLDALDLGAF